MPCNLAKSRRSSACCIDARAASCKQAESEYKRIDRRGVCRGVRNTDLVLEGVQDLDGLLPIAHLAVDVDEDVVGHQVGRAPLAQQLPIHIQRQLQLIRLFQFECTFKILHFSVASDGQTPACRALLFQQRITGLTHSSS